MILLHDESMVSVEEGFERMVTCDFLSGTGRAFAAKSGFDFRMSVNASTLHSTIMDVAPLRR